MPTNRRISFFESLDIKTRRDFLKAAAMAGVSTSILFGGPEARADEKASVDVQILNIALALEHQAIFAYTAGAATKLLSEPVLQVAVKFMKQHVDHRDALSSTIQKLGGKAVDAKPNYDIVKIAADVGVKELKTDKDILTVALNLEVNATNTYLAGVTSLANKEVLKAAVSIMADEAQHAAILRSALGQNPVPTAFVGF